jgi:hypothetical protein
VRLDRGDAVFFPLMCGELLLDCRDATAAILLDDVAVVVVWLNKNWLDPMRRSTQVISFVHVSTVLLPTPLLQRRYFVAH